MNKTKRAGNQTIVLLVFTAILMLGYQNCSNSMSFDGSDLAVVKATDGDGDGLTPIGDDPDVAPPTEGDPIATLPPGTVPPKYDPIDDDEDSDYDHLGRRIPFSCTTGAKAKFDEEQLKRANDLVIKNRRSFGFIVNRPVRNATVENVKGSIGIKNALRVLNFHNVLGLVSFVRAIDVDRVHNVDGVVSSTAAIRLKELHNVRAGFVCASAAEFGEVHNVHGLFVKVRGRADAAKLAQAQEFSNIKAGFISFAKLNVSKIDCVEGELIIRDSAIDEIEGFKGGLTLINTKVGVLRNAQGILRMHQSVIDQQINVRMISERVILPRTP